MNRSSPVNATISSKRAATCALAEPEDRAVEVDVLAARELRVEPGAELEQRGHAAVDADGAVVGPVDAGQALEQRALARAVVADDPEGRALRAPRSSMSSRAQRSSCTVRLNPLKTVAFSVLLRSWTRRNRLETSVDLDGGGHSSSARRGSSRRNTSVAEERARPTRPAARIAQLPSDGRAQVVEQVAVRLGEHRHRVRPRRWRASGSRSRGAPSPRGPGRSGTGSGWRRTTR